MCSGLDELFAVLHYNPFMYVPFFRTSSGHCCLLFALLNTAWVLAGMACCLLVCALKFDRRTATKPQQQQRILVVYRMLWDEWRWYGQAYSSFRRFRCLFFPGMLACINVYQMIHIHLYVRWWLKQCTRTHHTWHVVGGGWWRDALPRLGISVSALWPLDPLRIEFFFRWPVCAMCGCGIDSPSHVPIWKDPPLLDHMMSIEILFTYLRAWRVCAVCAVWACGICTPCLLYTSDAADE